MRKPKPRAAAQNAASKNFYALLKSVDEIATIPVAYLLFQNAVVKLNQLCTVGTFTQDWFVIDDRKAFL